MKEFEKVHKIKGKNFLFKVENSDHPRDYAKYEELRNEIWGDPKDSLPGARNMMCTNFLYDGSNKLPLRKLIISNFIPSM
jgi:hypothetical protein